MTETKKFAEKYLSRRAAVLDKIAAASGSEKPPDWRHDAQKEHDQKNVDSEENRSADRAYEMAAELDKRVQQWRNNDSEIGEDQDQVDALKATLTELFKPDEIEDAYARLVREIRDEDKDCLPKTLDQMDVDCEENRAADRAYKMAAELDKRAQQRWNAYSEIGEDQDRVGTLTAVLTELFKPDEIEDAYARLVGKARDEDKD